MPTFERNVHTSGKRMERKSVANVDHDNNQEFTITFNNLRGIESTDDVYVQATGGYVIVTKSVSGNVVTCEVHEGIGGTSAGELPLVGANTSDITSVEAVAFGY